MKVLGLSYNEIELILAKLVLFWDYEIAFAKKTSKVLNVCQGKLLECLLTI